MEKESFYPTRNNQNSYNSCAVKAVQAITGIERGKVALCLGYDKAMGVKMQRLIPGLAFLTGKKWIQVNVGGTELAKLGVTKALVITTNFDDPRMGPQIVNGELIHVTHMIAVIGDTVFDSLYTFSKITDPCWNGWRVIAYFHEKE